MTKLMRKFRMLIFALVFVLVGLMSTSVFAANGDPATAEAKIVIDSVSGGGTMIAEYYYDTVEEAFTSATTKEKEHNPSGKGGVITVTIELLKDSEVTETLFVKTGNTNFMLDFNGCSMVSSADPVLQAGPMTFVTNSAGTACSVTQKNVTTVSTVAPNTIFYAPMGTMMMSIAAPELTIGDNTGTTINSKAMLPSIMGGTFLGKLEISKPMFGAAISGGLFSEDPTPHIDTNAYVALKNEDNLYYLTKYHGATVNKETNEIIQKYGIFQDAIDAADYDGLVRVLKQDYPPKTVLISEDDKINMDLAGFQFTGAGSPTALVRVDGTALIQNKGILNVIDTDENDPGAFNFVYDATFDEEAFTTIRNEGTLYLNGIFVSVNYNHPNYKGNIYTLFNDSSERDAIIYIDSKSKVGGIYLEPEDPATGKYPAFATKGNGINLNQVEIAYDEDDTVTYFVDDCVIGEVMDVFDDEGNYSTPFGLRSGDNLEKRFISVKKDGVEIEFEYDEENDILTVPADAFTDDADAIEIRLKHEVKFVAEDKTVHTIMVEHGTDATLIDVPVKEGFTVEWDGDGMDIRKDTVITAVYTEIPKDPEDDTIVDDEEDKDLENDSELIPLPDTSTENVETGDEFGLWLSLMIVSLAATLTTIKYSYQK